MSQNPNIQLTLLPFYIGSNLFYFRLDIIKWDPASPKPYTSSQLDFINFFYNLVVSYYYFSYSTNLYKGYF